MCRERLRLGLLLRLGILLTAVCVFLHVYLQSGWQGAADLLSLRHLQPTHNVDQHRKEQDYVYSDEDETGVKGRIAYSHTNRRDGGTERRNEGKGKPSASCCPSPRRHRKSFRWHIDLEPWASDTHTLEDEAKRFLTYITTPQVSCALSPGDETDSADDWSVCLDPKYSLVHRLQNKHCRMYSFGLGGADRTLERSLASSGCEVHCFDPSLKQPHLQEAEMWLHRLSVDWRDPNPAIAPKRQYTNTKKLATILNDFGHREIDVLKVDMESAEWKILENLLLEGVLDSVGQLLLEIHLHWAGFEVGGEDPAVVRYWYSLLKELERAKFYIFHVHSDPSKPHLFLHKNILNASSTYTLSWVNTRWKPG